MLDDRLRTLPSVPSCPDVSGSDEARRRRRGPRVLLLSALGAGLCACAGPNVVPAAPVAAEASLHFYAAWRLERRATDGLGPALTTAGLPASEEDEGSHAGLTGTGGAGAEQALAAAAIEPDWIAPQRLLDDVLRAELRGPEALARRVEALAAAPDDAVAHYLVGRLGGPDSERLLDRSVELQPDLGWGWHGLAWSAHRRGDTKRALPLGQAALALARDPHEVVHFAHALSRYLIASKRSDDAVRLLDSLVRNGWAAGTSSGSGDHGAANGHAPSGVAALRPEERLYLAVELALGELSTSVVLDSLNAAAAHASTKLAALARARAPLRQRGARRALELLATPGTTEAERLALVRALAQRREVSTDELLLALSGATVHSREDRTAALRGEVLALRGDSALGSALRARGGERSARARVADSFRSGEPLPAFEQWITELPECVKDPTGAPLHPPLAALAGALRAAAPLVTADTLARVSLVEALIGAGWFDEAESLALRGLLPPALADDVMRRALAARTSFAAIAAVLEAVDEGDPSELVEAEGGSTFDVTVRRVSSVKDLLGAVRRRLVEQRLLGGLDARVPDLDEASPRIGYGPFAEVVHPGPRFSAEDERLGRGQAGAPVPGLAAEFLALGRHALFGSAVGQGGPDGALLRVVHIEERAGTHLGRPYGGTVFWCDGADVAPRFARQGSSISGAALHEGYWIDLERVEAERENWRRVARRFVGDPARVRAALDVIGPRVAPAARAAFDPALGANDRLRLAWMVEQGSHEAPEVVSLAALAEVVCVHEEGHLCDRAQWYPLRAHLGALLAFTAAHGFSPERIAEALEERAQLVALCCVSDPRLAWVDLLDAAERTSAGARGPTPHAAGYQRVLQRLLERLSRELDAGEWPELDGQRRLIDQLHRIAPEGLRALAVREARARGIVR
jgi:hypothetical protein